MCGRGPRAPGPRGAAPHLCTHGQRRDDRADDDRSHRVPERYADVDANGGSSTASARRPTARSGGIPPPSPVSAPAETSASRVPKKAATTVTVHDKGMSVAQQESNRGARRDRRVLLLSTEWMFSACSAISAVAFPLLIRLTQNARTNEECSRCAARRRGASRRRLLDRPARRYPGPLPHRPAWCGSSRCRREAGSAR